MTKPLELDAIDGAVICKKIEKTIRNAQVRHHEIFLSISSGIEIEMEKSSLKNAQVIKDAGFGLRVANDKGQSAFSYSNRVDDQSIKKTVDDAVLIMKKSTIDPDFHSFSSKSEIKKMPASYLHDTAIVNLEIEDAVKFVADTLEETRKMEDPRVYSIGISFSAENQRIFITNSNGVDVSEDHTEISATCGVTVKHEKEMNSDYDFMNGRSLNQVSPTVGSRAVERALKTLGKKEIKTATYQTVLGPRAVATVLGASLAGAANAEVVQQGMSFLHDKIGTKIAPECISVIDDARLITHTRARSCSFDGEGYTTGKTTIINKGILEKILHNSYTANKAKVKSTGNAARVGYESPPRISRTNLIVEPSAGYAVPDDDLIRDIKHGIYFDQTHDSANLATGDFSGMIANGFLIENGEITGPIAQAAFGINLLVLLDSIEAFGTSVEDIGGIICPAIRLKGLNVSGNL